MNFASPTFLLLFLPVVLAGFFLLRSANRERDRQAWLILASLVFYAASGLSNLFVLLASILTNFAAGRIVSRESGPRLRRAVLWIAILFNLCLLAGFKVMALEQGFSGGFLSSPAILIPLALSFITFQQIGFVVACHRGSIRAPGLFDYLFFVLFFPQLVMGPILQFDHISRQLRTGALGAVTRRNIAIGMAIFTLGLAKKVLLADPLAGPVDRVFAAAARGEVGNPEAWFGIIGFQFQLFLDFTAYAEMAIGLGWMFGIALPINFDAPFKSVNRFDLWRRWHITFVVFMRNHVFMPLVRHARFPPAAALAATALLSGLWHGLGWTFIAWALIQTAILLALHLRARRSRQAEPQGVARIRAIALTFLITCLIGGLFRAPSVEAAGALYRGLFFAGVAAPGIELSSLALFAAAATVIWIFPEPRHFFAAHWPAFDPRPDAETRARRPAPRGPRFAFTVPWGIVFALIFFVCLALAGDVRRFVYVQF